MRDRERSFEADSFQAAASPVPVSAAMFETTAEPMGRTRPARRDTLLAAPSRDDALAAWFAARTTGMNRRIPAAVLASLPAEPLTEEHVEPSLAELDLAFSAL